MHMRREGDWFVFYGADQETEVWRVKPPAKGFTMAELEAFLAHVLKLANASAVGPS